MDMRMPAIDLVDSFYQFTFQALASSFALDIVLRASDFGVDQVYDEESGAYIPIEPQEFLFACLVVPSDSVQNAVVDCLCEVEGEDPRSMTWSVAEVVQARCLSNL